MKKNLPFILFIFSILVHLFYYFSAFFGKSLNIFFENVTMGQDFFQIPNAAYAYLNGGSLQGLMPIGLIPYVECCGVNSNVYHPFFTLMIGVPLQFFQPWTGFSIWVSIHLLFTVLLILYFFKNFKDKNLVYIALSIFLLNSYHFYEIKHAQYHFLFNFFTVILISELIKKRDNIETAILYAFSLLVKPIGLLWILSLLFAKKYKTVLIGVGIYLLVSVPFILNKSGIYYFNNFVNVSSSQYSNYNFFAINHFININHDVLRAIPILAAVFILILQIYKKPNIFYILFLWIGYQLMFYSLVFHYHYTILPGIIALGIVTKLFSIKKMEIIPIIFLTLPSPVIYFRLLGDPPILPEKHLAIVALWSVFWLTCLLLCVIYRSWKGNINANT